MTYDMEISISQSPRECSQFPSNTILLDHFTKIFLHLRRAVVLAHRGGHWTLLQNACRELWNYTQESQSIAKHSHSHMDAFPITKEFLRNTIWLPFYLASDMIIDMITELQATNSLKIVDPEGNFCIPSCLGGITDENGGSNLHPQSPLDDVNVVDLKWICNLVFKTIELLYQMKKWESLVHIAVQFNIFTHERYIEQVIPLLVYAQRQLLERKQQFSSPESHESHFIKYLSDNANKTLFRASLPHPTSDCDFAQYEINMLIPGIDLFSDRYRADVSTVVASLNFLMFELHCAKQNLTIKVLTDIGFFTEAFHELSLLNCGDRIPWKIPAGYRKTEQIKALQRFDSSKSLLTVTNLQVLEDIFNWSVSLTMLPLCNQQIMNKLTLAKMHFIICLSATINTIPEKVEKHIYSADNEPSGVTASNVKVTADKNSRQQEQRSTMVQLVDCKDELNMAMLKGILLTEAEESLNHLVQNIQDKYDGEISQCSVEDIEALIEAKLQLAAIFQQWHQAAFSVALAFTAIRLLQDADIFRMKPTDFQEKKNDFCAEDGQLPHSTIAQDHMNMHLWLRCRKMLVAALVTQIHSIGYMEENYVAERRSVIKEVIIEAETFGDIETQAEMMVQAAILDLQERCPMAGIKLLQDIISLLQEDTFIFSPASLTLVKSMLLLADVLALQTVGDAEYCSSAVEPLNLLILAHEITIKAIFLCGESIEQQIEDSTLTCLVLPAKNIYLPHINLLAQVKMRIGRTLAEKVACTPERVDPLQWLCALKHLESALELCRESAKKELDIEAELLFQIGKVECQVTKAGNNKSYLAVETLLEAIKLSQQHDQNFELIRRSYLEIALLYMHFVAHNENVSQTDKMVPSKSRALKSEGYKAQAWIAVRAARQLLIGIKSVKEKNEVQQKIPEFASMDLLASYRDFLSGIPLYLVILEH
ncbi:Cilia- and flagella-associated protein 54 [Aix galericulata]|nr:Cilia- and flagella-associated protein 54 [Aix galericulata]